MQGKSLWGSSTAIGRNSAPSSGLTTLQTSSGGNDVGQNPYAFKSGIEDRATGFVKYGTRWYNPTTGTWTQQDTLDTPLNAVNGNRYAYAGDDPINNIDPLGLLTGTQALGECLVNGGIGLGFGALSGPQDALIGFAIGCANGVLIAQLREENYGPLGNGLEAGDCTHLGYELVEFLAHFL